jgi:KDO2-lipid IV(A) lauroyltransferase
MNRLGGYILYGAVYLFSLLPLWVHYRISDILYYLVRYVVRYRRAIVRKNLRNAFPDESEARRRQIEKGFYHFFCDYIVENVKLTTMKKQNVMKHMSFDGVDDMVRELQNHDLVFVYLGHYGNWEYAASMQWWVPKDIKCAQLYSRLRSDAFDYLFYKIRSRYGGDNINKRESIRHIMRYRQRGQKAIIGFISDQAPKWENIHMWMDFLHQDTPVFTGTERIAKKLDASVFYADMRRVRRGYYHCTFRLMTNDVRSYKEHELTAHYMHLLEQSIKADPCVWLWSHNRWKRQRSAADRANNVQEVKR